jgi:hypothetical protein
MKFTSPIDWESLRISSTAIDTPVKKEPVKKAGKKNTAPDDDANIPWDDK